MRHKIVTRPCHALVKAQTSIRSRPTLHAANTSRTILSASASLDRALAAASPRLSPVPTPVSSIAIHVVVAMLWVLLCSRAFIADNLFAWSAGLAYVGYDTILIALVFVKTLPLLRPVAADRTDGTAADAGRAGRRA